MKGTLIANSIRGKIWGKRVSKIQAPYSKEFQHMLENQGFKDSLDKTVLKRYQEYLLMVSRLISES